MEEQEVRQDQPAVEQADGEVPGNAPAVNEPAKENFIAEALPKKKGDGHMFGNLDKEQKFKFPTQFADHVVVRHFNMVRLPSGVMTEDPGSNRIQYYELETFQNMAKQKVVNGNQTPSQFEQLGIHYEVLHDPLYS